MSKDYSRDTGNHMTDNHRQIAMIFLDGVGIGTDDPAINPFMAAKLPTLSSMFGNMIPTVSAPRIINSGFAVIPLDATLQTEGLPQSGTGQTALFTGMNAAAFIGKHFGPYPYSTLHAVIERQNIFRRIHESGKRFYFANAYPKQFFDYVEAAKRRLTVTTLACLLSGIELHTADDLRNGSAISADLTNERWDSLGYPDIPEIPAQEAGKRFARLANEHDFVLFEYFLTDHVGHRRDMKHAIQILERFDTFLNGIREALDESVLLIMTSDHGNVEDLLTKTHTRNDVPLWVYGKDSAQFIEGVSSITDLTPKILHWLNIP
jgi:2,3-bisphosphoglycerate-independent phosphoglycerate mutase